MTANTTPTPDISQLLANAQAVITELTRGKAIDLFRARLEPPLDSLSDDDVWLALTNSLSNGSIVPLLDGDRVIDFDFGDGGDANA